MAEETVANFSEPGSPNHTIQGADLASAATIAPTHRIHKVTGTAAISQITLPYTGFSGSIDLVPTGAFTGATGGTAGVAIGKAFTAVAGKTLTVTYVPADGLWYPSYTS